MIGIFHSLIQEKGGDKMKKFKVIAWIHPKRGGDDRMVELGVEAESREEVAKMVEKWLKKRSAITNDYRIL